MTIAWLTDTIQFPSWMLWILVFTVILLSAVLWTMSSRARATFGIGHELDLGDLRDSLSGLTHGVRMRGNAVRILEDRSFFESLWEAIEAARTTINFETYLWEEGTVSDRTAALLADAARRGLQVRISLDASGGKPSREQKRLLSDAGVQLSFYHPFRLRRLGKLNNRDHRKIVVIDGAVGYVGGHCFTDEWWVDGDKPFYRDVSIRVEGPIVHALQSTFSENWIEETGDVFAGNDYFPEIPRVGDVDAHVARVTPAGTASAVRILHHFVIASSHDRIRIQNPYFLPDPDGVEELGKAVERGVDVRIMVPSASATDAPIVQHAGHHRFGAMLEAGVRIFEYERTLLHQKVITVDGVWSGIGSTNFDDRSFEVNDEITVGLWDREIAEKLEQMFERDLEHCVEMTHEEWKRRGIGHKLIDGLLFLLNEQL